jgi:hypothetical protein
VRYVHTDESSPSSFEVALNVAPFACNSTAAMNDVLTIHTPRRLPQPWPQQPLTVSQHTVDMKRLRTCSHHTMHVCRRPPRPMQEVQLQEASTLAQHIAELDPRELPALRAEAVQKLAELLFQGGSRSSNGGGGLGAEARRPILALMHGHLSAHEQVGTVEALILRRICQPQCYGRKLLHQ